MTAETLSQHLPREFPFYHLGQVVAGAEAAPVDANLADRLAGCAVVGFRLLGDLRGLLLVAFERDLDLSTYTELGNVIASQAATGLTSSDPQGNRDVMISPPQLLSEAALARLIPELSARNARLTTYQHRVRPGELVPVHVVSCTLSEARLDV